MPQPNKKNSYTVCTTIAIATLAMATLLGIVVYFTGEGLGIGMYWMLLFPFFTMIATACSATVSRKGYWIGIAGLIIELLAICLLEMLTHSQPIFLPSRACLPIGGQYALCSLDRYSATTVLLFSGMAIAGGAIGYGIGRIIHRISSNHATRSLA